MARRHRKAHVPWESPAERDAPQMCATTGKRMYSSEAEALSTAQHQISQSKSGSLQLRTYRCLYCDSWHLTSKEA